MTARADYAGNADRASGRTANLGGFLSILSRYKWSILLTTLAGLLAAFYFLSVLQPVYTAHGAVFVDPRSRKIVTDEIVQGGFGTDASLVESQVSIIASDSVLQRVVDTLALTEDPEFAPSPQTGLLADLKDLIRGPRPQSDPRTMALESLARTVKVKRPAKSYVLEVEVTASSPAKAARLANAVLKSYIADQTDAKSDEARRANALIDARLGELREKVHQAELRVDEFKKSSRLLTSEGGFVSEQQLGKLGTELATARSVAAEAKARYDEAIRAIRAGNPDALPEAIKSGLIQKLREQFAQIARREAALSAQLQNRHPVLIDVRSQLKELRGQIDQELRRIAAGAKTEQAVAAARERELSRQIDQAKAEVGRTNTAQIKLRELEQDLTLNRELLGAFMGRAKETQEQANISAPDARVITEAAVPSRASFPSPMLILTIGLLAGLGAGISRALIGDTLDPSVKQEDDVLSLSGQPPRAMLPVIGSAGTFDRWRRRLGSMGGRTSSSDFADVLAAVTGSAGKSGARYRQAVLRLLTGLRAHASDGEPHIVAVTSAASGSGASSTALALAYSAALQDDRTLLIDATSMDADLSQIFSSGLDTGTVVLLDSKEDLARITSRDVRSGLSFLPIAMADIRTLKTAQRRRLATGVRALAASYDLVIIDAGALLEDEAATALLGIADEILVVARSGVTSRTVLAETERLIGPLSGRAQGLVLNMADSGAG